MLSREDASIQSAELEKLLGKLNSFEKKNAPKQLFFSGDVSLLSTPRVSIIGARRATEEGIRRAKRLCRLLVEREITIVSGLAQGIDTAAHTTAIELGGRTIAVLGTSLDKYYPLENRDLQRRIMQEHLAVSQFARTTPSLRTNFPQRNRTMALLSDATVIVEAGESSGTLSQGWEALRIGRPLFFMKSVLENPKLTWPHEMLNYGARILTETEDLLMTVPPKVVFDEPFSTSLI